ncbi:hypothetical protein MNBD_GAMMA11-2479 [hydrothermal vent metagenome]|uniref:Uncharacterized protein n=1 Tax=hydrothermal vent metagenome TaxID=652676 RepID=A0A3B0X0I9_9ZZZZ
MTKPTIITDGIKNLVKILKKHGMPVDFMEYVIKRGYKFQTTDKTSENLYKQKIININKYPAKYLKNFKPDDHEFNDRIIDDLYHEMTHAYFSLQGIRIGKPINIKSKHFKKHLKHKQNALRTISNSRKHYNNALIYPRRNNTFITEKDNPFGKKIEFGDLGPLSILFTKHLNNNSTLNILSIRRLAAEAFAEYTGERARAYWGVYEKFHSSINEIKKEKSPYPSVLKIDLEYYRPYLIKRGKEFSAQMRKLNHGYTLSEPMSEYLNLLSLDLLRQNDRFVTWGTLTRVPLALKNFCDIKLLENKIHADFGKNKKLEELRIRYNKLVPASLKQFKISLADLK